MATIKEVARRAQVSVGTVSNVLSGLPTVSTELRERVEQAMAEMQYQPSHIARSLKLKHTQTLALVISDIMNPFFSMVVRGAEDAAAERELPPRSWVSCTACCFALASLTIGK